MPFFPRARQAAARPFDLGRLDRGLRNDLPAAMLPPGYAQTARNWWLSRGILEKRGGSAQWDAAALPATSFVRLVWSWLVPGATAPALIWQSGGFLRTGTAGTSIGAYGPNGVVRVASHAGSAFFASGDAGNFYKWPGTGSIAAVTAYTPATGEVANALGSATYGLDAPNYIASHWGVMFASQGTKLFAAYKGENLDRSWDYFPIDQQWDVGHRVKGIREISGHLVVGTEAAVWVWYGQDILNYTWQRLINRHGIPSHLTMVETPRGLVYQGSDGHVYLLPLRALSAASDSNPAIKLTGHVRDTVQALMDTGAGQWLPYAWAVNYDNKYVLSFATSNFTNQHVWVLDLDPDRTDFRSEDGPQAWTLLTGAGLPVGYVADVHQQQLIVGHWLDQKLIRVDTGTTDTDAAAVDGDWENGPSPHGEPDELKELERIELVAGGAGSLELTVTYTDYNGTSQTYTDTIALTSTDRWHRLEPYSAGAPVQGFDFKYRLRHNAAGACRVSRVVPYVKPLNVRRPAS